MGFEYRFKSVAGMYTGSYKSMSSMLNAHWGTPFPTHTANRFGNAGAHYSASAGQTALPEWRKIYEPATVLRAISGGITGEQFSQKLYAEGHISNATAAEISRFAIIQDDELVTAEVYLSLMAYAQNTGSFAIFPIKKEWDGTQYVDTQIGYDRTIGNTPSINQWGLNAGSFIYNDNGVLKTMYGFGVSYLSMGNWQIVSEMYVNDHEGMTNIVGGIPEGDLYSEQYGDPSEDGGYGQGDGIPPTFDRTSDNIGLPPKPAGVSELGFVNIYKCDIGALHNLGDTLFPEMPTPSPSPSDWLQFIGDAITALSDSVWNSKLIDYIISIHMIPVDVTAGAITDIKVGPRTLTGIMARPISEDYVDYDLGEIHVDEFYTNFLDYQTRAKLFLPFYGFIDLKPEYWQSATLSVTYRFNVIDGGFTAFVKSTVTRHNGEPMSSIIGQYSGCASVHCPTSGTSYASIFSGMVASGAQTAASIGKGNVPAVATSAMGLASAMGGADGMMHGQGYNATASFLGMRRAFLLIERPVAHFPVNYPQEHGIPSMVTRKLSGCHGYTIVKHPRISGINGATDQEIDKLKELLSKGVILP